MSIEQPSNPYGSSYCWPWPLFAIDPDNDRFGYLLGFVSHEQEVPAFTPLPSGKVPVGIITRNSYQFFGTLDKVPQTDLEHCKGYDDFWTMAKDGDAYCGPVELNNFIFEIALSITEKEPVRISGYDHSAWHIWPQKDLYNDPCAMYLTLGGKTLKELLTLWRAQEKYIEGLIANAACNRAKGLMMKALGCKTKPGDKIVAAESDE